MDCHLARALDWWHQVITLGVCEERAWREVHSDIAHLFCDASGSPAHLGCVLAIDGVWLWTHLAMPAHLMECFQHRRDNRIMGLELLAISLGLCSFRAVLGGRRVVINCDNKGAEVSIVSLHIWNCFCPHLLACQAAVRRGSARSWDHAQLVHEQWLMAAKLGMHIYIKCVASRDNIADLPSRRDFVLLEKRKMA